MNDNTIDSLKIKIDFSSNHPNKEIDKISKSLNTLQKASDKLNLGNTVNQLTAIGKVDISPTISKFQKLLSVLKGISKYSKLKVSLTETVAAKKTKKQLTPPALQTETATTNVNGAISDLTPKQSSDSSAASLERLAKKAAKVADEVKKYENLVNSSIQKYIDRIEARLTKTPSLLSKSSEFSDTEAYQNALSVYEQAGTSISELKNRLKDLQLQLQENPTMTKDVMEKIKQLDLEVKNLNKDLTMTNGTLREFNSTGSSKTSESGKEQSKLSSLISSIKRIALYRFIRALLKSITQAIKTGINNVVQYSEKANETFSKLKSSTLYVSNSIGASLVPAITAITPALQILAQKIVDISEDFAQLFATLNGDTTFLKAKMTVEDYAKSLNAAKKATTGFDEINTLGSNNSSVESMFEEVDVTATKADNVKTILGTIASILTFIVAKTVKWSSLFKAGSLSKIGSAIKSGGKWALIAAIVVAVVAALVKAYQSSEIFREKVDQLWTKIKEVFGSVSTIINTVIDLILNILDQLQPVLERIFNVVVDILNDILPVISKVITFISNIISVLSPLISILVEELMPIIEAIVNIILGVVGPIITLIMNEIGNVIDILSSLIDFVVNVFKDDWEGAWESIKQTGTSILQIFIDIWTAIKDIFSPAVTWLNETIIEPVGKFFSGLWAKISEGASTAWEGIKSVFGKVGTFFKDTFSKAWEGVVNVFNTTGQIFTDIKDAVVAGFKWVVNKLITGINNVIALPFKGINDIFQSIHDVDIFGIKPFSWVGTISVPEIPQLANGGFVDSGQLFIAREAGAELVGGLGGRTAVANNEQIVEGIKQGVIEAMQESTSGGDWTIQIVDTEGNVKSSTIVSAAERKNRRDGKTIIPLGTY